MDHSPLMRLPPELRNRIYEEVLQMSGEVNMILTSKVVKEPDQSIPLSLTTTCLQLRAETSRMFYALNTFVLATCFLAAADPDCAIDAVWCKWYTWFFSKWLTCIGQANIKAAKEIVFDLGKYEFGYPSEDFPGTWDNVAPHLERLVEKFGSTISNVIVAFEVVAWEGDDTEVVRTKYRFPLAQDEDVVKDSLRAGLRDMLSQAEESGVDMERWTVNVNYMHDIIWYLILGDDEDEIDEGDDEGGEDAEDEAEENEDEEDEDEDGEEDESDDEGEDDEDDEDRESEVSNPAFDDDGEDDVEDDDAEDEHEGDAIEDVKGDASDDMVSRVVISSRKPEGRADHVEQDHEDGMHESRL
jgi:hypothetical protein